MSRLQRGVHGTSFRSVHRIQCIPYAPFMRKHNFGTVRVHRAPRLKWLDLHNLLGVVTLAWALLVGATGIMNELATPHFDL
jgi:PepSY-associated TM region